MERLCEYGLERRGGRGGADFRPRPSAHATGAWRWAGKNDTIEAENAAVAARTARPTARKQRQRRDGTGWVGARVQETLWEKIKNKKKKKKKEKLECFLLFTI